MTFDNRQSSEDETKWGLDKVQITDDSFTDIHLDQLCDCSPTLCRLIISNIT